MNKIKHTQSSDVLPRPYSAAATLSCTDLDEFQNSNAAYLARLAGHPLLPQTTAHLARFG